MTPTVDPFHREGQVKFFVSNGTSKKLVFNRAELEALRDLVNQALGVDHAHTG